jgi:sporulation protein YlmC with PRC-barrel domain
MKTILSAAALTLVASTPAFAQQTPAPATPPASAQQSPPMTTSPAMMSTVPAGAVTVTNYYKQNVYDQSDSKIGEIADVLVDKEGRVTALIVSVGGFLGLGEKNVSVPFQALRATQKDNKWYLVMNTTKDALKSAPGYKYDRTSTTWITEKS